MLFFTSESRSFWATLGKIFTPIFIILTLGFLLYTHQQSTGLHERLKTAERRAVSVAQTAVTQDFVEITADLLIISKMPELTRFFSEEKHAANRRILDEFARYIETKRTYDQIRLIDLNGQEVVRVDFRGGKALQRMEKQLQNKHDRYYVQRGLTLEQGQIFVSAFDLNREFGAVEQPLKPILRFVTPVYDGDGIKRGLLVFNYLGDTLLQRLRETMRNTAGISLLAAPDGNWILGPAPSEEWGRDLGHGHSMVTRYPLTWKALESLQVQLLKREPVHIETTEGMATLVRVGPLQEANSRIRAADRPATLVSDRGAGYVWTLLTLIPDAQLNQMLSTPREDLLFLFLVMMAGAVVVSVFYARTRQKQSESEENLKLVAKVTNSTHNGVVIMNNQWSIISVNHAFSALTGFLPAEAEGRLFPWLLSNDENQGIDLDAVEDQVATAGRWEGELWHSRRNKKPFPGDCHIFVVNDASGKPKNFIEIFNDVSERHHYEAQLKSMAHYDALTGLPNRKLLDDRLAQAWAQAHRMKGRIALLYIDLDKFKPINDTYGHKAGDEILKSVALNMQKTVRESDTVARVGGDEFVVLLTQLDSADVAQTIAISLVAAIRTDVPFDDETLNVGASIGVAVFPEHAGSTVEMMRFADSAMYQAKAAGSGFVQVHGAAEPIHFEDRAGRNPKIKPEP